jgi:hypothetical protein
VVQPQKQAKIAFSFPVSPNTGHCRRCGRKLKTRVSVCSICDPKGH